jgi:hypothetical protein
MARDLGWLDDQYAEEGGDFIAEQRDLIGWKAAQHSWGFGEYVAALSWRPCSRAYSWLRIETTHSSAAFRHANGGGSSEPVASLAKRHAAFFERFLKEPQCPRGRRRAASSALMLARSQAG